MYRSAVFVFALATSLLGVGPLVADPIKMDDGKDLPTEILKKEGKLWQAWVVYDGLLPRSESRSSSKPADGAARFTFLQSCYVAAVSPPASKEPTALYLVGKAANGNGIAEKYGWVDSQYVVSELTSARDKETYIERKVMMVNSREFLDNIPVLLELDAAVAADLEQKTVPAVLRERLKEKDVELSEKTSVRLLPSQQTWMLIDQKNDYKFRVWKDKNKLLVRDSLSQAAVYSSPREGARRRTSFQISNIFYIYGEANGYVLLGTKDRIENAQEPEKVIKGWCPDKRLSHWNTREALEWDRPSTLGKYLFESRLKEKLGNMNVDTTRGDKIPDKVLKWFQGDFRVDPDRTPPAAKITLSPRAAYKTVRTDNCWLIVEPSGATPKKYVIYKEGEKYVARDCTTTDRPENGTVWEYPAKAWRWLDGNLTKEDLASFEERRDEASASVPFSFDKKRMPILDWEKDEKKKWQIHSDREKANPDMELLKVGWVGGLPGFEDDALITLQRDLEVINENIHKLEIYFIIEGTYKMRECWKELVEVTEAIARDEQLRAGREVRMAISYFNAPESFEDNKDKDGKSRGKEFAQLTGLVKVTEQKELEAMLERNRNHNPSAGAQPLEVVFDALTTGIKNRAGFNPKARKLVILIGMAGDRSKESNKETTRKKVIVDELLKFDSPAEFYAIQLKAKPVQENPKEMEARGEYAQLFEEQMKALKHLINADPRAGGEELADYADAANIGEIQKKIHTRLVALQKKLAGQEEEIAKLQRGEWHTDIGPALKKELGSFGRKIEDLLEQDGVQVYQEGYVWKESRTTPRKPQVRAMVLLSETDIQTVTAMLSRLVPQGKDKEVDLSKVAYEEMKRVIGDSVEPEVKKLGDKPQELTFKKIFAANKRGLPFQSKILKSTLEELENPENVALLRDLELKWKRLEDICPISDGKTSAKEEVGFRTDWQWGRDAKNNQVPIPINRRPERRHFYMPGDTATKWYWVDLLDEIP